MKKFLLFMGILTISLTAGSSIYNSESRCYYECDPQAQSAASQYDEWGIEYHSHRDYANAILLHYKACIMGYAPGCNHAGYMYDRGQAVEQSYTIARKYFSLACKYGSGIGCSNLGVIYERGQDVKQNDEKALTYYKKSCKLGTEEGCINQRLLWSYILMTK